VARPIDKIIIHCSDSSFGDVKIIDGWHKERGWKGVGYHWVILNGRRKSGDKYAACADGHIERGREEDETGSHAVGHNATSIGICMIGKAQFTEVQFDSLERLLKQIKTRHASIKSIIGHRDVDKSGKTCPNFDVVEFVQTRGIV
jgi:N-acetylmuramoyl-L-alanine amidase